LPKARASSSPVVGKVVSSTREIHGKIVDGQDLRADAAHDRALQETDRDRRLHHPQWARAFEQLLKVGVRAEQQSFARHDLNYVMHTYLPAKLRRPDKFLP